MTREGKEKHSKIESEAIKIIVQDAAGCRDERNTKAFIKKLQLLAYTMYVYIYIYMILIKLVRETRHYVRESFYPRRSLYFFFFSHANTPLHLALYIDTFLYRGKHVHRFFSTKKNTRHSHQLVIFAGTSKHAIVLFPSINA